MNIDKALPIFNEHVFLTGKTIKKHNSDTLINIRIILAPSIKQNYFDKFDFYNEGVAPFSNYSRLEDYTIYAISTITTTSFCITLEEVIEDYEIVMPYEEYLQYLSDLIDKNEILLNQRLDEMASELTTTAFFDKKLEDNIKEVRRVQETLKQQHRDINIYIKNQNLDLKDIFYTRLKEFPIL